MLLDFFRYEAHPCLYVQNPPGPNLQVWRLPPGSCRNQIPLPGPSSGRGIEISKNFLAAKRRAGGQAAGADGKEIPRFVRDDNYGPFHKYFQHIAKNLASGWRLVRVEGSSKSVRGPFIKSMPKRG